MTSIKIQVIGAQATAEVTGLLTGGMVGVPVEFTFDGVWEGLHKTAVFKAGDTSIAVPLAAAVSVPWEVLKKQNCTLYVGVYGVSEDGTVAIPTVWAEVQKILPGADPETTEGADPTLPIWKQAMDTAQSVRDDADMGLFDGYSPVRGEDYWTDEDIAQIKGYVDEAILGGKW